MDVKWGNNVVTGEEKALLPEMIVMKNSAQALSLINEHITKRSKIAVHCDVDMDGIGTGYIMGKFISTLTNEHPLYVINKDKVHGIQQKHVDYFKGKGLGLLIIVDSSTNDLDIIKQFDCDVLVVDHHEAAHDDFSGICADGQHRYIIVNNTISNSDIVEMKSLVGVGNQQAADKLSVYTAEDRMSCGLVVYELLRLYQEAYATGHILENLRLFQWAGVTLFTDAIILNTPRNQWYIENTVHSNEIESTLSIILKNLNPYKSWLDKSLVNYTIAPVVNKAIRAGHSGDALNTIVFKPETIRDLMIYKAQQDEALEVGVNGAKFHSSYITRDLTNTNIHKNYSGVIAGRLCDGEKNAVAFHVTDGIAEGSFRGRVSGIDYRGYIDNYSDDTWARGHKVAFGFKCPIEILDKMLSELETIEPTIATKPLLTAGKLNETSPGQFVIEDINEFKRQGGIWRLGIGNSKVSTDEQILITVDTSDAVMESQKGKLYIYDILGLKCKAFAIIDKPIVNIYVEYNGQIECYIK